MCTRASSSVHDRGVAYSTHIDFPHVRIQSDRFFGFEAIRKNRATNQVQRRPARKSRPTNWSELNTEL